MLTPYARSGLLESASAIFTPIDAIGVEFLKSATRFASKVTSNSVIRNSNSIINYSGDRLLNSRMHGPCLFYENQELSSLSPELFLLATLGLQVGALPDGAMNPVVAAAIISIMLNPVLYRRAGPLERSIARHPRLWRVLNRRAAAERDLLVEYGRENNPAHRAVIVGYGPIGQMVSRILRQCGIEPTVIEMNIETHRRLRSEGRAAVHGDANRREVVEQAGIIGAASLILSASGTAAATEATRAAREINPNIHVVARADYLRETELLRQAGASEVFSGEGEVALAIADSILTRLGATLEQMDEARQRIRLNLQRSQGSMGQEV